MAALRTGFKGTKLPIRRFEPAARSCFSRRLLPSIQSILTGERAHEVLRGRSLWRLRRAPEFAAGCRLDRHDGPATARRPLRSAALRLASGPVRILRLPHHPIIHDLDHCRVRNAMANTETKARHV